MGSRSQNLTVIMMWRAPILVVAVLQSCAALNFGRGENDINDKCVDCVGEGSATHTRFSMPLATLGEKKYYLGIFFKANWYKAEQYCRFHGMHLASINSAEEQRNLQEHIQSFGMGHEHFWTSGTDQAERENFSGCQPENLSPMKTGMQENLIISNM